MSFVGRFDRRDAAGLQERGDTFEETDRVGHVRKHVVRVDDGRASTLAGELVPERFVEERDERRDAALGRRDLRDVRGRLDAEHGNAGRLVILQQISVVAGNLYHQAVRVESPRRGQLLDVTLHMRQHLVGHRREIRIIGEQLRRRDALGDLHQRERGTEAERERIARLGLVELLLGQQCIRKRKLAERQDRNQRLRAERTIRGHCRSRLSKWSRYQPMVRARASSTA
jgi:hypothetical protein